MQFTWKKYLRENYSFKKVILLGYHILGKGNGRVRGHQKSDLNRDSPLNRDPTLFSKLMYRSRGILSNSFSSGAVEYAVLGGDLSTKCKQSTFFINPTTFLEFTMLGQGTNVSSVLFFHWQALVHGGFKLKLLTFKSNLLHKRWSI